MISENFGEASKFVTGKFPNYKISPNNNLTQPGSYVVTIKLTDDNPQPKTSTSSFNIIVVPLPSPPPPPPKPIVKIKPLPKFKENENLTATIKLIN